MKFFIFLIPLILCGCLDKSASTNHTPNSTSACKPIVAVYPVWKHSPSELNALPWHDFSHIAISSIYPMADGGINSKDADLFIGSLVSLAHTKEKKVIISVGGAGQASKGFLEITKDKEATKKFVSNLLAYVDKHNIDGIDIDWEYWTYQSIQGKGGNDPVESQQLKELLKAIKTDSPLSLVLTVDIMAGYWPGEQYLPELQKYADYVNLMAFDFTGAWPSSKIAYHSDYDTFKKSIDFVLDRGFDNDKILIGIPSYGIEFDNGQNASIRHHSYRSIVNRLEGDPIKISKQKLNNIYFETKNSVIKKFRYVQNNALGGIFMFEITSDHRNRHHSLLTPAHSILNTNCQPTDTMKKTKL